MRTSPVLILGGTSDARLLADLLIAENFSPITSLAGVTAEPILPKGLVRRGGFGSPQGMADYIATAGVSVVVDAAHPFAVNISESAVKAAILAGIEYIRLERPAWVAESEDHWISAESVAEAAALIPTGSRVLVTTGRKETQGFFRRNDVTGLLRTIEPPAVKVPDNWRLLLDRPPYSVADELALLERENISILVTKNSGGDGTHAKLAAARIRRIPVIMVGRPVKPDARIFWPPESLVEHLCTSIIA